MIENKTTPNVAIVLSKGRKRAVEIGGMMYMLFVAFSGLSLSMIQAPVLEAMEGMQYFSTITILGALGLAIMTPIGGKLGDIYGRRNIMVFSGLVTLIFCIGLGIAVIVNSVMLFMLFRLLLGGAQGLFTAAPYIILREINEAKDVPKGMGLLTTVITIGGFLGSILAGILVDEKQLLLAIIFPVIPLAIGIFLIGKNFPNKKSENKPVIDILGIIGLTISLTALLLSLNIGSSIGFRQPIIILGFIVAVVSSVIFIKVEKKAGNNAIVPIRLFKNRQYVVLLFIGWITYFYQIAMNTYIPLALLNVIGVNATVTGMLQFPRTIFSIFMPILAGSWVSKKSERFWKAMAIAMACYVVTFLPMCFTNPEIPAIVYIMLLSLTGIGDAFKSVSITPSAQAVLETQDLGIGTALLTFFNSTGSLFAAAIMGVIYDANIKTAEKLVIEEVQSGVNGVFMLTTFVVLIGLFFVFVFVRKDLKNIK